MSAIELTRAGILARVAARTLTLRAAATLMNVSYRQAKRLATRHRAKGAAGLRHGHAGRPSNRATANGTRTRVLALIRAKYGGAVGERFGPTLAAEHLASEDGITIDHALDAGRRSVEPGAQTQSCACPTRRSAPPAPNH